MAGMYSAGLTPTNVGDDEAFALFEDGEAAMFITGPWYIERIKETGINFSIDAVPGAEDGLENGAPFLGGQGFFISAFSENQLLAEIFLTEYVATTEFMQSVFERDPRGAAWLGVDTSVVPEAGAFNAAGASAVPMPTIPEMAAVWSAAGNSVTLISQGEDPIATVENAKAQIDEAIGLMNSDARIVGLPGSYQAAAGCATDWDPGCDETLMVAGDDGIFTLTIDVPAGEYEFKIAINKAWDENYGVDGVAGVDNIPLVLDADSTVTFTYDDNTNTIEITTE
ncbi:MAG: extracellular solute-binding protein [Anaerolineae bacterium]|nr:extracellular solute-binding protein [Anaerolineae bacterium]